MTATPLPEATQPPVSIPYNLYFHGLDKPHWTTQTDGFNPDPDAQRRAEKSRAVVGSARRRRVAGLHDSIRRLEKAVFGLSELDETGFTDVAAQHLERRLANTVSQCRSLLADIEGAVHAYRRDEVAETTPPPPVDHEADDDEGDPGDEHPDHDQDDDAHVATVTRLRELQSNLEHPERFLAPGPGPVDDAPRVPTPAEVAQILRNAR